MLIKIDDVITRKLKMYKNMRNFKKLSIEGFFFF